MRPLAIVFFSFAHLILFAQEEDSLKSSFPDSISISYATTLPLTATGFTSYTVSPDALENNNGISFLNTLYSAVPGLGMDALPYPQSARFRSAQFLVTSPTIIWDGVPYYFDDFKLFLVRSFNAEKISMTGPAGLAGFGPLGSPGGVVFNTPHAHATDNWKIDLNSYPILVNFDGEDATFIFTNNVALSKAFRHTRFRFFYNHDYEPPSNLNDNYKTTYFGQQSGLSINTGLKNFTFHTNVLFHHNVERRYSDYDLYKTKHLDFTAKAKLTFKITRWLSLSGLASKDLNKVERDDQETQRRFFFQPSLEFSAPITHSLGVFGQIAYQNDSMYMDRSRSGYQSEKQYGTQSWIGTFSINWKDFLWTRATIQSNNYSINRMGFTEYSSFFAAADIFKALNVNSRKWSLGILHMNISKSYDYVQFLNFIRNGGFFLLYPIKNSLETGVDVIYRKTRLQLTYFKNSWGLQRQICDSGYCQITTNTYEAANVGGVEALLKQPLISKSSINWRLSAGIKYSTEKKRNNVWNKHYLGPSVFINSMFDVKRFFGNALIDLSGNYYDGYTDASVPLREIAIGYKLQTGKNEQISSTRISLVGKNLIVKTNENLPPRPYPYYSISFSADF